MTKLSKLRTLERGMTGREVTAIQHALNIRTNGRCLPENGHFGPLTEAAVREYQGKNSLHINGKVDNKTRASLFPIGVRTTTLVCTTGSESWKRAVNRAFKISHPQYHLYKVPPLKLWLPIPFPNIPDLRLPRDFKPEPDPPKWPPPPPEAAYHPPVRPLFRVGCFVYDHREVQPGQQYTLNFERNTRGRIGLHNPLDRDNNLTTLTISEIYSCGPEDAAFNQELSMNWQLGFPPGYPVNQGPVTVNPYVQYTNHITIGNLGRFELLAPFAQAGVQFQGPGDQQFQFNAGVFPIHLSLKATNWMAVDAAVGFVGSYTPSTDEKKGGVQTTLSFNFRL